MSTTLLVGFLILHGLLHLAIWMPHPTQDPDTPPPFIPDHSALLTAMQAPASITTRLARALALATTTAYLLAGGAVGGDTSLAAPAAVAAAALALALKALFFHPWLTVGVLLDVAVLTSALTRWPFALT